MSDNSTSGQQARPDYAETAKKLTQLAAKQAGFDLASAQAKQQFMNMVDSRVDSGTAERMYDNIVEYFNTDDPNQLARIQSSLESDAMKLGGSAALGNLLESVSVSQPIATLLVTGLGMAVDHAFGNDYSIEARFIAAIPGVGITEAQAHQYINTLSRFTELDVHDFKEFIDGGLNLDTLLNSPLTEQLLESYLPDFNMRVIDKLKDGLNNFKEIGNQLGIDLNEVVKNGVDPENLTKQLDEFQDRFGKITDQGVSADALKNLGLDGNAVFDAVTDIENFNPEEVGTELVERALKELDAPQEMIDALTGVSGLKNIGTVAEAMQKSGFDPEEWNELPEDIRCQIVDGTINPDDLKTELGKYYDIANAFEDVVDASIKVAGQVMDTAGNIAMKAVGGITSEVTQAGSNLVDLVSGDLDVKFDAEKDLKADFSKISSEGAINAGAQAWIDGISEEQGWSDLEKYSAKVALDTIETKNLSTSATNIGVSMATDMLWDTFGEQMGLSAEEVSQSKAAVSVLSNLNTPTKIGLDTAFTALGLGDELGSSAVANQMVPPESSEASTLGMIGGAVGSYVGSVVPVVGTYLGNIIGTGIGTTIGNAIFGSDDPEPESYATVVFNENTGEFEIESSCGNDGLDGSMGENLAQNVLDALNGKEGHPGLIDRMTGEDGQVANGRYIEPITIGYKTGSYRLNGEVIRDAGEMIEKATITSAQAVRVEDGNTYVQQAVYQSDENGGLSDLMNHVQTAFDYQTLVENEAVLQAIRLNTVTGEGAAADLDPGQQDDVLTNGESQIDSLKERFREIKAVDREIELKQETLSDLEAEIADPSEPKAVSVGEGSITIPYDPKPTLENIEQLKIDIGQLADQKSSIEAGLAETDPKLVAIAEYRESVEEAKEAAAELKDLSQLIAEDGNTTSLSERMEIIDEAGGLEAYNEKIAAVKERIGELTDIIEQDNDRLEELIAEGGKNFYAEATDWDAVRSAGNELKLDQSDQHADTSRLNILLENELDLDLDSVSLDDLMLEVNTDGSLDIGFRIDGEEWAMDVDELSHKVRIDNWKSWSVSSTLAFSNGKSYEIKPLLDNLAESNADNERQLDMKAKIVEIWGEDANIDEIDFAFGSDKDDTIVTSEGNDYIDAHEGDNIVQSGAGNDFIRAGDGNNAIDAGAGDDQVVLGNGANVVTTGEGDDTVSVGDGDNQIDTADGEDRVVLGDGSNVVDTGSGDDVVVAGDGDNVILTGEGADEITLGDGDNVIDTGMGDDRVTAGDGNNTVIAADGDDEIALGDGNNTVDAGSGDDTVSVGDGDQQIFAGDGNNTVTTGDGNSTIVAGDGSEDIDTGDGNQRIDAGGGDNRIEVGNGNSTIVTEAGKDRITTGDGDQQIFAGEGNNTIHTGEGDSRISAKTGDDRIETGDGNQIVDAGDGDNVITTGDGDQVIQSGSGEDTVVTGEGDQTIFAGGGDNTVQTGYGDSTITAGEGNDTIETVGGDHRINAGDGDNTVQTGQGDNTIITGTGDDRIISGSGDQTISAGDGDNTITAGDGNSSVVSGAGDDAIELGDGNQSVHAGDGNNTIIAGDGDQRVASGSGDDWIDLGDGHQTVVSGAGDDAITAGHGDHTIVSGAGDDTIDLGAGDYTVSAGDGNDTVTAGDGDSRISTGSGDDTITLGDGIHDVDAGSGNNRVTVGDGGGSIRSGDGNDRIATGDGDWEIAAGDGDNTIRTGTGNDTVTAGSGDDSIDTGAGNDTILAGDGNNTIDTGAGADAITTGSGDDTILAGSGDDTISAGAGADVIDGGEGIDTVEYRDSSAGIEVDLETGSGFGGDAEGDVLTNVENVLGSDNSDIIFGNDQDNTLEGGAGDDLLSGGMGADRIMGGSGDDTVSYEYGDAGSDISLGGSGELGFERSEGDILEETENVVGGSGDDRIQGNLSNNRMQGGAGDDTLYGLDGDDFLAGGEGDDRLYGGEGDDILTGGAGDDILFGEAGNDVFIAGEGNDTIIGGEGEDTFFSDKEIDGYTFEQLDDGIVAIDKETGDKTTIIGVEGFQFGDQALHINQIFDLTAPVGMDSISTCSPEDDGLDPGNAFEQPRKKVEDIAVAGLEAAQLAMAAAFGIALTTIPTIAAAETADGTISTDSLFSIFTRPLDDSSAAVFQVNTVPVDPVQAVPESTVVATDVQTSEPDLVPAADDQVADGTTSSETAASQDTTETDTTIANDEGDVSVLMDVEEDVGEATDERVILQQEDDSTIPLDETAGEDQDILVDQTVEAVEEALVAVSSDGETNSGTDMEMGAADEPELVFAGDTITADGCAEIAGSDGNDVLSGDGEDLRIELDLTASLSERNANDGHTALAVVVTLPDGVNLSQGTYREESGDWLLEEDEIAGVEVIVPVGSEGFSIQVQPVAEKNGAYTYGDVQTLSVDVAGVGNDLIDGELGDDTIDGGLGDDILIGGDGSDRIDGGAGSDLMEGGAGNDDLTGGSESDMLLGGDGADRLDGSTGNDSLLGGQGSDSLYGGEGDDILSFDESDLQVDGGAGYDIATVDESGGGQTIDTRLITDIEYVRLSSGNDTVLIDESNDYVLDGGDGFDVLDGTGSSALDICLADTVDDPNAIVNVEKVIGSGFDDTVAGNSQDDEMYLGAGNDTVSGADGNDLLYGESGADELSGDAGDDLLVGGTGADSLSGGVGNDRLVFDGDDTLIDGGSGVDTAVLDGSGQPVYADRFRDVEHIELADGNDRFMIETENDYTLDGGDGYNVLDAGAAESGIELTLSDSREGENWITGFDRVEGSAHDDIIIGDSGANTLLGSDGNDTLAGNTGNDELYGGLGADSLSGGEGDDVLYFDENDTLVSGGSGEDRAVIDGTGDQTVSSDIIDEVEHVELGSGDDRFLIMSDNDYTLDGGGGHNILDGSQAGAGLTVALSDTAEGASFVYDFDEVVGSDYDDSLTGSSFADTMNGGAGADLIHGGQGNDTLAGGEGDDTLFGDGGVDTLSGGAGNDSLHFESIDGIVDGGEGYDQAILTNSTDGTVVDVANFSGIEHFELGASDERFELYETNTDYSMAAGGGYDIVDAGGAGEGVDLVLNDSATGATYLTGVEEVIGSDYADTLTGDGAANTLGGGAGDDVIDGGAGADFLAGGAGNDTLVFDAADTSINGGSGLDTATLADTGDGSVIHSNVFSNVEQVVLGDADETFRLYADNSYGIEGGAGYDTIDAGGAGTGLDIGLSDSAGGDAITGVEAVSGTAYNDILRGNSSANTLSGNTGSDTLYGGGGNDILNGGSGDDILYGDSGADSLSGGDGNDSLYFDTGDSLDGGSGADTAFADTGGSAVNISNTFFSNIENVVLTNSNDTITFNNGNTFAVDGGGGSDSLIGSGSSSGLNLTSIQHFENVTGSAYNDTLVGDATDTTYDGGTGDDTITGGGGIDTAVYHTSFASIMDEMQNGGSSFVEVDNGTVHIQTSADGYDTLQQVEQLQFSDITIDLNGNTAPYARGEIISANNDQGPGATVPDIKISKDLLLANDHDIDLGDSVADIQITGCSEGSFEVRNDFFGFGDVVWIDPDHNSGSLQITYEVIDSRGAHSAAVAATINYTYNYIEDPSATIGPPLIFDLDRDGAEISDTAHSGVLFDIDSDGVNEKMTTWAGADDGFLAYDVDGDGTVTKGEEIVLTRYHPDARTDLEGLALAFDSNDDGVFDANDETWNSFGVWQDADQDGTCDDGEFRTLSEMEIASIDLNSDNEAYDVGDAHVYGTGTYLQADGTEAEFADTALSYAENAAANQETTETDSDAPWAEDSEYQQFLGQYATDVAEIQADIGDMTSTGEEQAMVLTHEEQIQIAAEIAVIHQDYNADVLVHQQMGDGIDDSQGHVDHLIGTDLFLEHWLEDPHPDFLY